MLNHCSPGHRTETHNRAADSAPSEVQPDGSEHATGVVYRGLDSFSYRSSYCSPKGEGFRPGVGTNKGGGLSHSNEETATKSEAQRIFREPPQRTLAWSVESPYPPHPR